MADSNITKRALAGSLKEVMEEMPFSKISITDICDKCDMNRKSFYYHFRDKYDLVNWIYQTEFISVAKEKEYDNIWEFIMDICLYLFNNADFYRKALQIEGQNSFFDYFTDILFAFVAEYTESGRIAKTNFHYYVNFLVDAFTSSIRRWMLEKDLVPPEEFVPILRECIRFTAELA